MPKRNRPRRRPRRRSRPSSARSAKDLLSRLADVSTILVLLLSRAPSVPPVPRVDVPPPLVVRTVGPVSELDLRTVPPYKLKKLLPKKETGWRVGAVRH